MGAIVETAYGVAVIDDRIVSVYAQPAVLEAWARRPGLTWPCSELARSRETVCAVFDRGGLLDLEGVADVSGDELSAWSSDVLRLAGLRVEHPAYAVSVGQFAGGEAA
jgi:hypothetical protein